MGFTVVEKIAAARAGDAVDLVPHHVMTHDNSMAVIEKFRAVGGTRVADPRMPVIVLDHDIQNRTPDHLDRDRAADRLRPHLAFLALWLDADGSFERLPVGKELGLPGPPARAALPAELKPQGDAGGKKPGMPIPGGTAMLAKALGLEESSLKEKDAAAHIFASVLQAGPIGDDKLESNPLRKSAVAVLRDYRDFIRHLEKRKLIPSAPGRTGELKLVFPLSGDKEVLSRTTRFLSFSARSGLFEGCGGMMSRVQVAVLK